VFTTQEKQVNLDTYAIRNDVEIATRTTDIPFSYRDTAPEYRFPIRVGGYNYEAAGERISRNLYSAVGYSRARIQAAAGWVADNSAEVLSRARADGFCVIGTSGVSIAAAAIAVGMNAPVLMARKDSDGDHHGRDLETMGGAAEYYAQMWRRVVFLDDLIATGNTLFSRKRDRRLWRDAVL
jgi:hypothetical protein